MNSGNWIIDNIVNALNVWNDKLQEIWQIVTQSPESFKGGGIWGVVLNINAALKAIGYALLVLFFVVGIVKTCGSRLRKSSGPSMRQSSLFALFLRRL